MANKSANPFLMMDEDYVSPSQASSNPFLMAADDFAAATEEATSDNPFFGQATNPFAGGFDAPDFDTSLTAAVMDFFTSADLVPSTAGESIYSNASNDMFETTQATETITTNSSFFHTTIHDMEGFQPTIQPTIQPQKPTDLQLKQTNTIASSDEILNAYSSEEELANKSHPRRPPPPRPIPPPPSKETQDLILSVTGHMDFTSSHLLDRIPATRTPSPVSMRDLHSPSPTPDHSFAEFLNVDEKSSQPAQTVDFFDLGNDSDATVPNLMPEIATAANPEPIVNDNPFADIPIEPIVPAVCDINQNQSIKSCPPRPTPPRPPRPTPPQKPPPPVMPNVPIHPSAPTPISHAAAPPHPPAPKVAQPAPVQAAADDDFMDIFGDKPKGPPPPKSNQDILSLFSATSTTTAATTDLLSDDIPIEVAPTVSETQRLSEPDVIPKIIETPNIPDITHEKPTPETSVGSDPTPVDELSVIEAVTEQETSPKSNPFAIEEIDDFASHDSNQNEFIVQEVDFTKDLHKEEIPSNNIFETISEDTNIFHTEMMSISPEPIQAIPDVFGTQSATLSGVEDEFDAFSAKFDSAGPLHFSHVPDSAGKFSDPFGNSDMEAVDHTTDEDVWGNNLKGTTLSTGFADDDDFDSFHGTSATPTPNYRESVSPTEPGQTWFESKPKHGRASFESDEEKDFSVVIRPIEGSSAATTSAMPVLAPPPKSPMQSAAFSDTSPRFNPFDKSMNVEADDSVLTNEGITEGAQLQRTDSQETPPTPLFDEDVSQPLEEFPRIHYDGVGWEMQLRQPNKKRITGQRFWKKIFLKVLYQGDSPMIQLFNAQGDKDPFTELPLQACYSVSEIGAQQYDHYGKIFTIKLQYIFYKERPGVRPGQVKKAERITNKLSQFAAYAIQGDYQGVKEFGSDLKKLGLPVEHAPQISQLFKIGCANFEDLKQFSMWVEEGLFKLNVHRDRALNYKMEEVQITAVDELYVEQDAEGRVLKQIARVRLFFLGFLTGMPDVELGVNDMWRQGKEVVGRHDIIPVVTEEWIRLEAVEFHACVQQDEYEKSRIIKFKPPDACYIELMRFRIRPPKNRELPLQLKAVMCVTGNKVELKADVLVPGFASRKLGQVPCEDVMIRFPIPECWIYLFRVEKHFRYGSVKSAHRRTGKIKGIERFLGTVETLQESLIEVTSGQAKYEHQHRAIVWRMPRLPKEGQGAYTTHQLVCRMALTSYDQIPDQLADYAYVEFTMPATQASHTTVRSVSLQGSDSDEPPEKYVRYLARHEYKVGIEHTQGEGTAAYAAATMITRPVAETKPAAPAEVDPRLAHSDTDSDSD